MSCKGISQGKINYARDRAKAVGRAYLISNMGHVMINVAENNRLAKHELGGIACIIRPPRKGLAGLRRRRRRS